MDAFFNQLAIVLLVSVAALLAYATYKVVYSKMNQADAADMVTEPEEKKKNVESCPIIRRRDEVTETREEKGETKDGEHTENAESNE